MVPFFSSTFSALIVTLISEFETTQNSFLCGSPLQSILVQFLTKSYQFGQLIILFWKVDTLSFVNPPEPNSHFFLGSSSRTMLDCLYFLRYLAIWSLLNRVSCVPFMSVQFTDPRTHVSTCQRANCIPTSHWRANAPNCVRNFQLRLLKSVPIFQLFFKRIFQFFNYSIMLNICKFQKRSFGGVL